MHDPKPPANEPFVMFNAEVAARKAAHAQSIRIHLPEVFHLIDKAARQGNFTVTIPALPVLPTMRAEDVLRAIAGYLEETGGYECHYQGLPPSDKLATTDGPSLEVRFGHKDPRPSWGEGLTGTTPIPAGGFNTTHTPTGVVATAEYDARTLAHLSATSGYKTGVKVAPR